MNRYDEGLELINKSCGNGKDNVISVATISTTLSGEGLSCPCVREVDAYYEKGVFYITTYGLSNKIIQIQKNKNISFSVALEGITGIGYGENLGWVLDPKNAEIRLKVREAFKDWYDQANYEPSQDCVILALHITQAYIFRDHGATQYKLDLVNECELNSNSI